MNHSRGTLTQVHQDDLIRRDAYIRSVPIPYTFINSLLTSQALHRFTHVRIGRKRCSVLCFAACHRRWGCTAAVGAMGNEGIWNSYVDSYTIREEERSMIS